MLFRSAKQTPPVQPGDTYFTYINRMLNEPYGMNLNARGRAEAVLNEQIPDDEGWAFGGAHVSAPEVLHESATKAITRTEIEFGDTLWMAITKFAERFSMTVGCVGYTVVMGDEDFRVRGQQFRHRLTYNPGDDDVDPTAVPLLSFKPESSVKNNTQSVEIRRFDPKQQLEVEGPPLPPNFLASENARKYGQTLRETPPIRMQAPTHGVVSASGALLFPNQPKGELSWDWLRSVADLLGYMNSREFDARVIAGAYDARTEVAIWLSQKMNISLSDPLNVEGFLEARMRDTEIAQGESMREFNFDARMNVHLSTRAAKDWQPPRQDPTPTDISDRNIQTKAQAEISVEEYLQKWTRRITVAEGSVRGTPTLICGHDHDVTINSFGSIGTLCSGSYRVISVRHTINEDGYITHFAAAAPKLLFAEKGSVTLQL